MKKSDTERLYDSMDRNGQVTIKVDFNPMLLAMLGYYNPLKIEDKPDLNKVEENIMILRSLI